ncbi:MAG: hypothetical protein QQN41_09875 [Nitrosopumilus sp.]
MKSYILSILLKVCIGEFFLGWLIFLAACIFAKELNLESNSFPLNVIGPYYISFGALGAGMLFGKYFMRKESNG